MPDSLTPAEQAAIAAYRGPITRCPPCTYSPYEERTFKPPQSAVNRSIQRGQSTVRLVVEMHRQGLDMQQISKKAGVSMEVVRKAVRSVA